MSETKRRDAEEGLAAMPVSPGLYLLVDAYSRIDRGYFATGSLRVGPTGLQVDAPESQTSSDDDVSRAGKK
jgi:hypothetical protein